jgi:hypothetical protein
VGEGKPDGPDEIFLFYSIGDITIWMETWVNTVTTIFLASFLSLQVATEILSRRGCYPCVLWTVRARGAGRREGALEDRLSGE